MSEESGRRSTIAVVVLAAALSLPSTAAGGAERPVHPSAVEAPSAAGWTSDREPIAADGVDGATGDAERTTPGEPESLFRTLLRYLLRVITGLGSSASVPPAPSSPAVGTVDAAVASPPVPSATPPTSAPPGPAASPATRSTVAPTVPAPRTDHTAERPSEQASADQSEAFALLNDSRKGAGLPTLRWDDALGAKAQAWAEQMAADGRIYHSTLMDGVPPGWRLLGENVGYGGSIERVHQGYLGSPGHRANIEKDRFTHAATGVARAGGRVYTAQVFMQR